jgi:hypothetical protein
MESLITFVNALKPTVIGINYSSLVRRSTHLQVAEEMSYLRIHGVLLLPSEKSGNSVHVSVIESCHEDGVKSVQMAREVPEARLAGEATIH